MCILRNTDAENSCRMMYKERNGIKRDGCAIACLSVHQWQQYFVNFFLLEIMLFLVQVFYKKKSCLCCLLIVGH